MASLHSSRPKRRPSLADVAKLAGVALMTASYAMRNSPRIATATRERVQRAAAKLGYVPNPEIGRLMHLLRAKRIYAYQASIAIPYFAHGRAAPHKVHHYTTEVVQGAVRRAQELGYSVDQIDVDVDVVDAQRLGQILAGRGIQGVLIPPMPQVMDCSRLLDWSRFSAVAATNSAQHLAVRRVVPHHFANFNLLLETIIDRGYRRPGLVTELEHINRVGPGYWAALALQTQAGRIAAVPALMLGGKTSPRTWFRQHRPDVLITNPGLIPGLAAELKVGFPGKIGLVTLDHAGSGRIAGIDQRPATIGEGAAELLIAQLQRGERGFMPRPHTLMVDGCWMDGDTVRLV